MGVGSWEQIRQTRDSFTIGGDRGKTDAINAALKAGGSTNTISPGSALSPGIDALANNEVQGRQVAAPPPAIDLTDETLRAARNSQLLKLMQGQGRASTFLTGPAGDTSTPSLKVPRLGNGSAGTLLGGGG